MNIGCRCILLAVLSGGAIRLPQAAAQELIVNGGFEEPALGNGTFNWFQSIPGWTALAGGVEVQNHVAGSPHRGAQHVELDTHTPSGITQGVPTQGRATYQLTFAYSPRPGIADNAIQVWWNGEVVDTLNRSGVGLPDTDWTIHSYNLAGVAPTSLLEFRDVSTPDRGFGGYIDTVSLDSVACDADCDTTTGPGVLDVLDFLCFQSRYDVGAPYACDCDTSTGPGACDIFDFLCFQNAFSAGCP